MLRRRPLACVWSRFLAITDERALVAEEVDGQLSFAKARSFQDKEVEPREAAVNKARSTVPTSSRPTENA